MYKLSSEYIMDQINPIKNDKDNEENINKELLPQKSFSFFSNLMSRFHPKINKEMLKIYPRAVVLHRNHLNITINNKFSLASKDSDNNFSLFELMEASKDRIFYLSESSLNIMGHDDQTSIDYCSLFKAKNLIHLNPNSATTIIDGNISIKNLHLENKVISGVFAKSFILKNCSGVNKIILPDWVYPLNTLYSGYHEQDYVSAFSNKGHYPGSFFIYNCVDLENIEGIPVAINIRIDNCPKLSGVLKVRKNSIVTIDEVSSKNLIIEYIDIK